MTFTEAAEAVLRKVGKPLHYKKITQLAIEQNLLSHVGKTPEVTMSTRLATLAKKDRGEAAIVRVKPGVFGLRDWGSEVAEAAGDDEASEAAEGATGEGEEAAAATGAGAEGARARGAADEGEEAAEEAAPASPEEQERAQRMAAAAQLFPEEEDDDEPVLGEKPVPAGAAGAAGETGEARGRRRRRRRRGGRAGERVEGGPGAEAAGEGGEFAEGDEGPEDFEGGPSEGAAVPAAGEGFAGEGGDEAGGFAAPGGEEAGAGSLALVSSGGGEEGGGLALVEGGAAPAPARNEWRREGRRDDFRRDEGRRDDFRRDDRRDDRRDERRDEARVEGGAPREEATGRDAADLLVSLLNRRDDRQPVPLRALVDDALRAGKLTGEPNVLVSTLSAAARADVSRREQRGERPRLRVANGRIGLIDWALGPDIVRAEADALIALERLRDAVRRQVIRRLNELPQAAFTELTVLLLERMGISSLRTTRRPGLPQGEVHLAGVARRAAEEIKVAVLIKRGGEVGRERVIELRGSLHHYGPAASAWIVTTGNVLSGAREEAAQTGTAPVTLIDGAGLGRLFDEHGVGVRHAAVNIPYPDLDLIEALRG